VLLEGPRSVGKSTLLHLVAAEIGATVLDLDDPSTRDAVAADPATFVATVTPVCVDEYQKAPIVLDAIKAEPNRDGHAGRFVLTGSTRPDALPAAAQALTGRLSRLTIRQPSRPARRRRRAPAMTTSAGSSPAACQWVSPGRAKRHEIGGSPSMSPAPWRETCA